MTDKVDVKVENNTIEEVAYKLMSRIVRTSHDEKEILTTYERCLKIVRGYDYKDLKDY